MDLLSRCQLFAALSATMLLVSQVSAQDSGSLPPAPVVIETAQYKRLAPVAWYAGSVVSQRDIQVAAEEAGPPQQS